MTRYSRWLAAERGVEVDDYAELWKWSVDQLEDFWASIWDYFEVISSGPRPEVLTERTMPGARWFEGAELNYAEHIFRGKDEHEVAVVYASELPRARRAPLGGAPATRWPRPPRRCARWASPAATGWSPTSPTGPRP